MNNLMRIIVISITTVVASAATVAKTSASTASPVATTYGTVNLVAELPWWQGVATHVSYPSVFILSSDVLFDSGSAALSPAAASQLAGVVAAAREHPSERLIISGYTDSVPETELRGGNVQLSARRANAVAKVLELAGIATSRVVTHGYGDSHPVAPNTPGGQPANRRVVIRLGAST